jgi:hypothetical protein
MGFLNSGDEELCGRSPEANAKAPSRVCQAGLRAASLRKNRFILIGTQ